MKQLLSFSLLLFMTALLAPGCKKNNEPEPASGELYTLGLAAHQNFNDDQVNIFIDGQSVFNKKITTRHTLSLADKFQLKEKAGNHTITVIVNGLAIKTQSFTTTNNLWIGINYDGQNRQISFVFRAEPFVYD